MQWHDILTDWKINVLKSQMIAIYNIHRQRDLYKKQIYKTGQEELARRKQKVWQNWN